MENPYVCLGLISMQYFVRPPYCFTLYKNNCFNKTTYFSNTFYHTKFLDPRVTLLTQTFVRLSCWYYWGEEIQKQKPGRQWYDVHVIFYENPSIPLKVFKGWQRRAPWYERVSKVSGLAAAWSENCKWYSFLPLGAVVSLFYESV
jgi:hypothetical protein